MSETCILFFVKYPEAGKVKTRLAEVIGDDVATNLYRHFVQDMLQGLQRLNGALRICYAPDKAGENVESKYRNWLGPQHEYRVQQGENLGERMKTAFGEAFADGYQRVVLMGSDIPDFPSELVEKTLLDLDMRDAALGPAFDGGYYLIGFRRDAFKPEVFEGITWSSDSVFRETYERMRALGLEVLRLPDWNDVDTIWDLNLLYRTNRNSSFRKSATFALLRENNDLIREYDVDLPVPGQRSSEASEYGPVAPAEK